MQKWRPGLWGALVCFYVCGFIGWIYETLIVWLDTGKLTERGILLLDAFPFWGLPLIPIYGLGGVIMCMFFGHWRHKPLRLFFIGMVVLTLVELLASYWCQYVIGQTYWDYTGWLLNFQGRICLVSALTWGLLSVLAVKIVAPLILRLYTLFKHVWHWRVILSLLSVYTVVCMVVRYR